MSKRHLLQHDNSHPPCPSQHIRVQPTSPVFDALYPVLPLFPSFLFDADAARLLRSSHIAALALRPDHAFRSHVFEPAGVVSLCRLRDLSLTYGLHVTQLCSPRGVKQLTFHFAPPHLSPIPLSVLALTLSALLTECHLTC